MKTTSKETFPGSPENQASAAFFPTATHQGITGCLFTEISVYLKAREPQCHVMATPFTVIFKNPLRTCLQPDITVVRDEGKLDEEGCHGAPDWVIEVVSPASRGQDYGQKLGIYINAGVREYWIVDSDKKIIVTYCLEHPDVPGIYHFGDIVKSDIYPDLVIDSSQLDHIQYKKAAGTCDNQEEDLVASLVSAVKRALSQTDVCTSEPSVLPDGLVESIVAGELIKTGRDPGSPASLNQNLQSGTQAPQYQDCPAAMATAETPVDGTACGAAPETMADPAEVKAFILEHFAGLAAARNKAQLMKAAMSVLKGRAESRLVNEAVVELCK